MQRITITLCFLIALVSVVFPRKPVSAQAETDQPLVAIVISFQQDHIRLNSPVPVTIWIINQSDIPVSGARLIVDKPDFIVIHLGSCDNPAQTHPIDLGAIPPNSVSEQPVSICFTLDRQKALAGTYNILTSVIYEWEEGTGLLSEEKTLQVDLIGMDTILGIPLGFAGFVLPGLMILVILRWFKVPIAIDMEPADRFIYGILLSLILLGPFSWIASQPWAPAWITWLDFQQQVSIERLAVFVFIGLVIGLAIGLTYTGVELQKERAVNFRASLRIKTDERPPELLKKALLLNPKHEGKRILLISKDNKQKIYGYHYAVFDKTLYVFAHFQLIIDSLPIDLQTKVRQMINSSKNLSRDSKTLLAILNLLNDDQANAFMIANPVQVMIIEGEHIHSSQDLTYVGVEQDLFLPPQFDETHPGGLLEVLEETPY